MATDNETKKIELATLYEIRLIIDASEKDNYSKEEILRLIDQIATAKK